MEHHAPIIEETEKVVMTGVHGILVNENNGIPFSGIFANQRLVNEDWLALGNLKLDIQHTMTLPVEGISQVWNAVATDNDILSYIADTLLISFQDKKCLSYGTEDKVF